MSSDFPSQALDKFVVRLPDGMREKIGVAARASNRTMNAEIIHRLEHSFAHAEEVFLVLKENTAHAEILLELPGSIEAVRKDIAELQAALIKSGRSEPP